MEIQEAIRQIKTFWVGDIPLPEGAGESRLSELQEEFGTKLPPELQEYIRDVMSLRPFCCETVGNPMEFLGVAELGARQEGYSFVPSSGESLEDWSPSWFLLGQEGGDPIIIDLSMSEYRVQRALHGMGEWDFNPEADSIGQFLLCSAAVHHALTHWGPDVITDDEDGFNLTEEPASWLFPNMKRWAGEYYEDWCSGFDNS